MPQSEAIDIWGSKNGVTTTPNTSETLSPEGVYNATKLTATTTDPYIYQSLNVTADPHTMSLYVKGVGDSIGKVGRILFWYIGSATGTTTSHQFTLTGDWQRIEATTTPTGAGSLTFRVDIPADISVIGDEAYIYGIQVEAGSYPTSYIPTYGSSVTRSGDVCINAGNASTFNDSEGVLYAEMSALADDLTYRQIGISGVLEANQVNLSFDNVSNRIGGVVLSSGTYHVLWHIVSDTTTFLKVALKYKLNDISLWINGVEVDTEISANTPINLNELNFSVGLSNANKFYGNAKQILYFPTALTDSELSALTRPYNTYQEWVDGEGLTWESKSCTNQSILELQNL